jgi:diguanylate cyclase (GGDEF)-like protein
MSDIGLLLAEGTLVPLFRRCLGGVVGSAVATMVVLAGLVGWSVGWAAARRERLALREWLTEANRDSLTRLPSRAVADRWLDVATRERVDLCVALLDVDGLKAVNDRWGHRAGDAVLVAVADGLRAVAPPGGVAARLGGDEFVVLAPRTRPHVLAAACRATLCGQLVIGGRRVQVRASVGIAATGGGDARDALACADVAMYRAKRCGGGTAFYDHARDGAALQAGVWITSWWPCREGRRRGVPG